ncbi:hypothetical protein FSP39_022096 [Pinctada imbricata]|uniref:Amino acid transporter n=1 Tax=Pinctada imbricata TaxID=66713 RepID=A0AA88XSV3_PINIB|nr:hypothetical protein FSP39_022096 [Pinctada imbricata]
MGNPDGRRRTTGEKIKGIILDNLLIIFMVIAVIIGVSLGLGLRSSWTANDKRKIFLLQFPGDLLMNMLKMLILPLVISSLISAMASLDPRAFGRMGTRAVVYYLTTTLMAVIIGIILVLSIRPGKQGGEIKKTGQGKSVEPLDALFDLIRNCFPNNLVTACFQKVETKVTKEMLPVATIATVVQNMTNNMTTVVDNMTLTTMMTVEPPEYIDVPKVATASGMNILGLVVFSIFFGGIIARMDEEGAPLRSFFVSLHVATMKLVNLVIWYAPIGIIFLIASKLVGMKDPEVVFKQLGYYMATVLAGLAIHAIIVLPLIFFIFTRRNPYKFMYGMTKAMLTAWGTASSSATLPITMECLRYNNNIDPRVAMFVAPIGATINMDGTALYEAVASIFIAQYIGRDLNVGEVIVVSLTSTAAAIGAAGVPEAGLVTMTIVLTAVGLPVDEIALILTIDWFLDRFRTAINVLGDSFGAGIVQHLSRNDLEPLDETGKETGFNKERNGHVTDMDEIDIKLQKKEKSGIENPSFSDTKM